MLRIGLEFTPARRDTICTAPRGGPLPRIFVVALKVIRSDCDTHHIIDDNRGAAETLHDVPHDVDLQVNLC